MKYQKPELVVLPVAIDAIQNTKAISGHENPKDPSPAYEDWE